MAKFSENVKRIFKKTPEGELERPMETLRNETPLIKKGDSVRVKRTNGEIEPDWIVHEIIKPDDIDPYIRVRKEIPGGEVLEKDVPLSELKKVNDFIE